VALRRKPTEDAMSGYKSMKDSLTATAESLMKSYVKQKALDEIVVSFFAFKTKFSKTSNINNTKREKKEKEDKVCSLINNINHLQTDINKHWNNLATLEDKVKFASTECKVAEAMIPQALNSLEESM
jgi:septal ring factor EnvC (AmiA/AmiB activator)